MSDFSTFALFTAGLATFAPLVAAIDVRGGSNPTGPAVNRPGYGDIVPAGKEFAITWDKSDSSCGSTVDLVLLHGPSSADMQAVSYIVKSTSNSGTYLWTPSNDLEPTQSSTGYGIELLCSGSNAYQYTTQFGISNDNYKPSSSSSSSLSGYGSSSSSASASASGRPPSIVGPVYTTEIVTDYTTYCPYATSFAVNNKTYTVTQPTTLTISNCPCTVTKPVSGYGTGVPYPAGNSTQPKATGTISVPSSLKSTSSAAAYGSSSSSPATTTAGSSSSSSATAAPTSKGAASQLGASIGGLVIAAGVAVFAL